MNRRGFTLIELLIVIAVVGLLAAAVLVAVDPVGRIQDARNARRWSEADALLNAVLNKQVDDRAVFTGTAPHEVVLHVTNNQIIVATDAVGACSCPAVGSNLGSGDDCFVNLSSLAPGYIAQLPVDEAGGGTAGNTGYYLRMTASGRLTVGACHAEPGAARQAPVIQVTR